MSTNSRAQPPPVARQRAVLIEDDDAVRRSLQLLLYARGYVVRAFGTASPFLADPRHEEIDLLVTDYRLPDGDGLGVLRAMHLAGWHGRSVLITAFPSAMLRDSARDCGFDAILEKPLRPNELANAILPAARARGRPA
ncbi:MAG: response regulator [Sphingomonas sp.]